METTETRYYEMRCDRCPKGVGEFYCHVCNSTGPHRRPHLTDRYWW